MTFWNIIKLLFSLTTVVLVLLFIYKVYTSRNVKDNYNTYNDNYSDNENEDLDSKQDEYETPNK